MNRGSCSTSPSAPEACITLPALSPELYPPQPALLMSDFPMVGDLHPEPSTMGSSGKGTLNKIPFKGSFKGSGTLHGTRINGAPFFFEIPMKRWWLASAAAVAVLAMLIGFRARHPATLRAFALHCF